MKKTQEIAKITAHVLFVAFLYLGLIYYLRDSSSRQIDEHDKRHITAADFTVEMDITDKMWQTFLNEYYPQEKKIIEGSSDYLASPAYAFKSYLAKEIKNAIGEFENCEQDRIEKAEIRNKPS